MHLCDMCLSRPPQIGILKFKINHLEFSSTELKSRYATGGLHKNERTNEQTKTHKVQDEVRKILAHQIKNGIFKHMVSGKECNIIALYYYYYYYYCYYVYWYTITSTTVVTSIDLVICNISAIRQKIIS
jgi:hypothetical protein